ncbi:ATP-binding protein [Marinilabilia salmonicolor]|jgi:MinD superfamily P-loop ATPase|uniref:MinD superfamily P-loop ATPase n=1 Tax=Marinilabilia salmonicolor TaxID=989 RepID=A0A2T0XIJ1_9BACT|nr:ATP-binding protein [Marinilabilia salmonicolor]PRY98768.1 MinD superfamily P-loop ATPase [Marinilabilia salmonicolor]RCW38971.1 MinD superfamily P-loop ATPase [Marinilabilia salmonicolor]
MKEVTILSGKGGAGKTSVTAAIASVAENAVFCDNDVDAADLHLILNPEVKETHTFFGAWVASIDEDKCTNCGICKSHCHFDAIHYREEGGLYINPFQCEGCRLCERVCPVGAITSERSENNFWYVSDSRFGPFVHAKMGPGEENSGKLVTEVRRKAGEIAKATGADFVINDGPPGIGCSAISSVTGTNAVLLVIEPTRSGLHDARRLVELVNSFKIPLFAFINKDDIIVEITKEIERYLTENDIAILGRWGFDTNIVESMVDKKSVVEYAPGSETTRSIKMVWEQMKAFLEVGKVVGS